MLWHVFQSIALRISFSNKTITQRTVTSVNLDDERNDRDVVLFCNAYSPLALPLSTLATPRRTSQSNKRRRSACPLLSGVLRVALRDRLLRAYWELTWGSFLSSEFS